MSFIKKYLKLDKDLVIEIDEVEYLINDGSVKAIENSEKYIPLLQLYDRIEYRIALADIRVSLEKLGPIDYLEKRK